MKSLHLRVAVVIAAALCLGAKPKPLTGPETEKRFPPLKLPAGFRATLFACDPFIEYPSAIAVGPRPRSLFVAIDYMTGLGEGITRRDEIRLIEDTDGDGYADKSVVFADKLNSVQGLTYHNGTLYVMHAPYLTAFRDGKGKGSADERRDLFKGFGLAPEEDKIRLHNANGIVAGHDGWLYLALGDHGCDVLRPEGDRLVLHGGGILRCRPDGKDLHVFATGLRNIYDIALDPDLNVFIRDNENDGGNYKVRVCHSFFGADHGYPYLYEERPDEALRPLADLGLGSSAGGVCYQERAFPKEYRGNLFFCEWGRAVMRYPLLPAGSSFAPVKEIEFAAGADNDPYGFKPTDAVVMSDGSLAVSDWADGQRPRRGRGRVYRITHVGQAGFPDPPKRKGIEGALDQLDDERLSQREEGQRTIERGNADGRTALRERLKDRTFGMRARLHAVWILAREPQKAALDSLFNLAANDREPRVRAQAIRALADFTDPVLVKHRLDAGPGDPDIADRLASLPEPDPRVQREIVIALGRLQWSGAPAWLARKLKDPDDALAHAAMQTMRRSRNWLEILKLLDAPHSKTVRTLALRALSERAEPAVVDGLLERLKAEKDPARRRLYADTLSRVARKPARWVYWGFRPAPRPANSVAWDRTEAIDTALDRMLVDPDRPTRLAVLQRMQREKVPVRLEAVGAWLRDERDPVRVAVLLESLQERRAGDTRALLLEIVQGRDHQVDNRLAALNLFANGLDGAAEGRLLELANQLEPDPVLAEVLRQLGKRPALKSTPVLARYVGQRGPKTADVRAAALEALGDLGAAEGRQPAADLLDDGAPRVRQAAAFAAGKLAVHPAAAALRKLAATDADAGVRRASLEALRQLRDVRVVPLAVAALSDPACQRTALDCLADLAGAEQAAALTDLARRNPAPDTISRVTQMLGTWLAKDGVPPATRRELARSIAEVQGAGSLLIHWRLAGPLPADEIDKLMEATAKPEAALDALTWRTIRAGGDARVRLEKAPADGAAWLAAIDLAFAEPAVLQFHMTGSGNIGIWVNGGGAARQDSPEGGHRFAANLNKGNNRVLARIAAGSEFALRFRRQSARAEHEALMRVALGRRGNAARGRALFLNVEKSLCLKCHRLGDQGEKIGPELTGVGARFARAYLVESILEPSRTIAPSFDTLSVTLKNGKIFSGIKTAETPLVLTLADAQGVKQTINKADIEERQPSPLSTMPEGLEKRFTEDEFLDLIEFLTSQKDARGR